MRKTESEMNNIFNVIPDAEGGSCTILLYGEIGPYADVTAKETVVQLMEAAKQYSRINLRINSVGGEVATAIAIFNAIREVKSDVIIYIDCIAASAASFIAACGREVKMSRYAQLMIHRPMGMAFGNADNLKDYTSHLEQIENILCDIYSKRTGMSVDEIKATYMDGQDHWIDAEEAVRLGFADEIYDDLDGQIDYLVAGAGSGGTYSGVVKYLKEKNPSIKGVLADPVGSTMGGGEHADYNIEGIGNDFIADTMDMSLVDKVIKVNDEEAFTSCRELTKYEGILGGSSTGAAFAAVKKLIDSGVKGNIVFISPDRSDRYFSKELYA